MREEEVRKFIEKAVDEHGAVWFLTETIEVLINKKKIIV